MLHMQQMSRLSANPHTEFARALAQHPDQVYAMKKPVDINAVIQSHPELSQWRDQTLTVSKIWQGEKLKGKAPHIFTNPIRVCAVIEETVKSTAYGESYDRISIQPCWITGNLVIVKEETHADDHHKKMIFIGREVDIQQAKALLIPAILKEIQNGSTKAQDLVPKASTLLEAESYLQLNFERDFYTEKPALFNVQHGVIGDEDRPFETWDLVRLAKTEPTLVPNYQHLHDRVENSVSTKLYEETLKHFAYTKYGKK